MSDVSILSTVVFGAPGTGKSTLCDALRKRNASPSCRFRFAILDEPTHEPRIVELLQRMYAETADDIAAGMSVAADVQNAIMQARVAGYIAFLERLGGERLEAHMQNKALVIVCDGHVLTDAEIYVRSKHDAKQISDKQMASLMRERRALFDALALWSDGRLFTAPAMYCQLMITNDASGEKHHHRVCTQRGTDAEQGVDPAVFARLADYADQTLRYLPLDSKTFSSFVITNDLTPEQVCDRFIEQIECCWRTLKK